MDKYENMLMLVAIVAAGIALVNLSVTINKVGDINELTGHATDTGTANLTIEATASINFTTDNIDWGSGTVDTTGGATAAYLDTKTGTVTDGNWTANSAGLIIENIGNVNVTLELQAGKNAATFIGGTSPSYDWLIENVAGGSCVNPTPSTFKTVNSSEAETICDPLIFNDLTDDVRIHFNVTVPYDAKPEAKGDIITATATVA